MNLIKTQQNYKDGILDKADYIEAMYKNHHQNLFDFQKFINTTDINKIEITQDDIIFDCGEHGIKIVGVEKDFRLAPIEILNFSKYEPEETQMMLNLLPKGAAIFDIGANVGWYSFLFSANDPSSTIFSFEPIPKTFDNLKKNFKLNKPLNISIFDYGLSNQNTDLNFYYYPEGSGNASSVNVSERENIITITSKVKRLDDCIEALTPSLDFIKCDVEGAELLVFQGGINTLKNHQPIVFSEILRKWSKKFNYHPNDIINLFQEIGYRCFVVKKNKLSSIEIVDDDTIETNYFFLHKEKHQHLINQFNIKNK